MCSSPLVCVFGEGGALSSISRALRRARVGRLTDNKGRTVSFRESLLNIMTPNVGSKQILQLAQAQERAGGGPAAGLGSADGELAASEDYRAMRSAVKEELGNRFKPEFLNRLDEVVVFSSLARPEVEQVAALMIDEVVQRCAGEPELTLSFTPALKDAVVTQGYSATYGARPLRRAVRQQGQNGPCLQQAVVPPTRSLRAALCAREEEGPRRLDAEEGPLQRSGACPKSPTSPPMSLQVQRLIEDPVAAAVRDTACNHSHPSLQPHAARCRHGVARCRCRHRFVVSCCVGLCDGAQRPAVQVHRL